MSSLNFLAHKQLHEVLFAFLPMEDVLNYRSVHSECDEVVTHFTCALLQDVFGQDLSFENGTEHRMLDPKYLNLLTVRGDDIGQILAASSDGVRSVGRGLLCDSVGGVPSFGLICSKLTPVSVHRLLHVDLSFCEELVLDAFYQLVAAHCPQLRSLQLCSPTCSSVNDDWLGLLATNCRELRFLDVSFTNRKITDASMKVVATNCLHLQTLNLCRTDGSITDETMSIMASNCTQLQSLNISYTAGKITDATMKLVAMSCRQLKSLDVSGCEGSITDDTMMAVGTYCRDLVCLLVGRSVHITDASMKLVTTNCTGLRLLDVSQTGGMITDDSMKLVAMNCPHLTSLNVSETEGMITDDAIKLLATNCSHLRMLNVSGTKGRITDESISVVATRLQELEWLSVLKTEGKVTSASLSLFSNGCSVFDENGLRTYGQRL